MLRLQRLRSRFEVAADTLHPELRALLSVIGASSNRVYNVTLMIGWLTMKMIQSLWLPRTCSWSRNSHTRIS